jgi:HK97 family phage major capsid protein
MGIEAVRAAISALLAERATAQTGLDAVRANSASTADEITAATAARDAFDPQIDELLRQETTLLAEQAREDQMSALHNRLQAGAGAVPQVRQHGDGVIVREERTYNRDKDARGQASFFADMYRSQTFQDPDAQIRLQRHTAEVRAEGEFGQQQRATTTSSYGGLIPPQYLVEQAALLMRAGRPFANSVMHMELPDQGMSFVIPRGTTGASAAVQATQNTAVSSTDQVFTDLTIPVATVAGQQDVSRQSLERGAPGTDQIIYNDIAGAYGVAVDVQALSGTGTGGQVLGTLATSGINQATAYTAAATPQTLYTKLAGQLNAIETTRFLAPTVIYMAPRRWNWLLTQFDTQNRPLVVPNANGPMNALGTFTSPQDTPSVTPVGTMLGLPVITDASIPLSVGTGPEDQIIVARREDLILWEDGDGMPRQLRFEQTLGANLTVKLVAYGYIAFTAGRYPTAVGVVGGNSASTFGQVAPTF